MNGQPYSYNPHAIPPPPTHTAQTYSYLPPGQANYVIHTDDAATKLSDRVRRKCFNCRTTDTSTWRRSSLTPGKVLCNKCGLFERTHSRPRPEQFPHRRGPVVTSTFKSHRPSPMTPPPSSRSSGVGGGGGARLPGSPRVLAPLPPHHYDHPSIAPLVVQRQESSQHHISPPSTGPPPPAPTANPYSYPVDSHAQVTSTQQQQVVETKVKVEEVRPQQQPSPAPTAATSSSSGGGGGGGGSATQSPRIPSIATQQEHQSPAYSYRSV